MSEQGKTLAPGTILERRYRIVAEGTSQDLGTAYQAYDIQQGQQVILLVLDPRWGGGERALYRLEEVQQAVANLAAPGLLPYEHVGMADGRLYVVRTRAEEYTLADLQRQGKRMEIGRVLELGIKLCEALAPAHRAGFVHGSLSPQSVLLGALPNTETPGEYSVTLADNGLLPALHGPALAKGRPWGRIPYLSPEQAAGEQIHATSDVYVIGCLLYEMLTGRPPFRASDEMVLALQHLRHEPPSLQVLVPHVPAALAQIVHRAIAKEPAVRYRNAGQLAYILKAQVGGQPAEQPAAVPQPAWERLVVPPPPVPSQVADWTAREVYELQDDDDWSDEPAGVDWLMIGLLVAALIAVLGLIPLWRTVYRRYAGPPPASEAGWHIRFEPQPLGPAHFSETCRVALLTLCLLPEAEVNLDVLAFIWYNSKSTQSPDRVGSQSRVAACFWDDKTMSRNKWSRTGTLAYGCQRRSPSLGVQLTGFSDKV
jgi:serine/threonine protein kinase